MEVSRRKRFSYYQSAVKAAQKDYNSTVANILGNDDVDQWLKRSREGQDGIVF